MKADLVIRGGTIVDGSGNPSFTGDVIIEGDRIAAIGKHSGPAAEEIDARGKDSWSEFTGKVGLNWEVRPENLLYFHWTPGYKAGTIETAVAEA